MNIRLFASAALLTLAFSASAQQVTVYPGSAVGPVKEMNCVNNGPTASNFERYRDLKIPYMRPHDAAHCASYGGQQTIDISGIFPDFDKDVNDPASYYFGETDLYIERTLRAGTKVFYRLGESIQNATVLSHTVMPPKDFKKWAQICEHVIRHYNEGWADGFHYNIEYWEIWNEPDLDQFTDRLETHPWTWGGTPEQFYELYGVTARHLKECFPSLKIGGPAFAGSAIGEHRQKYPVSDGFLAYVEKNDVPLDFFSYHRYTGNLAKFRKTIEDANKALAKHGLEGTETCLDEWNYARKVFGENNGYSAGQRAGVKGAVFASAVMSMCQYLPVDRLMYYDFRTTTSWNGVFEQYNKNVYPTWYSFLAWRKLAELGTAVKVDVSAPDVVAAAAVDGYGRIGMLVTRYNDDDVLETVVPVGIKVEGLDPSVTEVFGCVTDEYCRATQMPLPVSSGVVTVKMEPNSFVYIDIPASNAPAVSAAGYLAASSDAALQVHVSSETAGPVKNMNSVNNLPLSKTFDRYKALKIPYARTHDTALYNGYGKNHVMDISSIFPDFDANVNDPKSYNFKETDFVLERTLKAGTQIFFRLGQSIEHGIVKYHVWAPKNFKKWAQVCEHIVRHYNEGWADGHHWNIEYWEIWNEPDLDQEKDLWKNAPRTWGGTPEQFYELYATTATLLKKKHPGIKVGGPAFASVTSKRALPMIEGFLTYMKEHSVPVDFFSYHCYAHSVEKLVSRVERGKATLEKFGYGDTETWLNEWNYVMSFNETSGYSSKHRVGIKGGAYTAAVMCACQTAPIDNLMYYDLRPMTSYNGAFSDYTRESYPAFYALYGWRKLSDLGTALKVDVAGGNVYAAAAVSADGSRRGVMVVRYNDDDNVDAIQQVDVRIDGISHSVTDIYGFITDDGKRFSEVPLSVKNGIVSIRLQPNAFAYIEL